MCVKCSKRFCEDNGENYNTKELKTAWRIFVNGQVKSPPESSYQPLFSHSLGADGLPHPLWSWFTLFYMMPGFSLCGESGLCDLEEKDLTQTPPFPPID